MGIYPTPETSCSAMSSISHLLDMSLRWWCFEPLLTCFACIRDIQTFPHLWEIYCNLGFVVNMFLYQYSETNVVHFLFSLLTIKGLYMLRVLLTHSQEVLNKRHLVCCVRVMSFGCTSSTPILVHPTDITRTQYTKCRLCIGSWGWASDPRNM
jgi:hypothetical protein